MWYTRHLRLAGFELILQDRFVILRQQVQKTFCLSTLSGVKTVLNEVLDGLWLTKAMPTVRKPPLWLRTVR